MSESRLLDALLHGLDVAALERAPDGGFVLLADAPAWFAEFFPESRTAGAAVALTARFLFLEHFLDEASRVWGGATPSSSARSGIWLERREDGADWHLDAVAVRADDRALLLIEIGPGHLSPLQHVIQRGREQGLALHDERRAAGALRDERAQLERLVAHGAAALVDTSLRLDDELTHRRRAESLARFLMLAVDSASELICTTDVDLVITYANRAFAARFGYGGEGTPERRVAALAEEPAAGEALEARARSGHWSGDLRCVTAAGESFPATVSVSLVLDESATPAGCILVLQDISGQLRARRALAQAEEQLRHAVKMEAIGHLAGGIAHDFNNLLTAIIGYSELALADLGPEDPAAGDVRRVRREADRAAALTRQLLLFSRRQVFEPEIVDLREVTANTGDLLRRVIGEAILLETPEADDLWPVLADAGQLGQLIVNLAVNARDAMPDGGTLTVSTANAHLPAPHPATSGTVPPGDYVTLTVRDTGIGIDPVFLPRIFEPFFTTKARAKGTGLGLSVVYGIVQRSGGHIDVTSRPRAGTAFTVYLPRADGVPSPSVLPATADPPRGGGETILLVEDEGTVRDLLVSLLAAKGYDVLAASSGADARALAAAHEGPIHLLVTDVILPGENGRQVAEALADMRPGLDVLYISGYTDDVVLPHGIAADPRALLRKPFLPADFLDCVRQRLDLRGSATS